MAHKPTKITGFEEEYQMKLVFKHQFLGYRDYTINNTEIKGQLKETSGLSKGEMCHLMDCVYSWCASHGCRLSLPQDYEYAKWQSEQVA